MIRIENINKRFKKLQALNNINAVMNKGQVISLIGPNGSGKTTTTAKIARRLTEQGKRSTVANVAVARELVGFLWAAMTDQPLRADAIVINKVDTADQRDVETVRHNIQVHNPKASVFEMACRVSVPNPSLVKGQRVLVVEDGPTLTHGEMPYGAGVVAARQCGAAELVDPRPYAVGSIRGTYERYRHLTNLLPAMGYSAMQRHELEETIRRKAGKTATKG